MKATLEHELVKRMIDEAVKAEREACALICDEVLQDMRLGPLEKYRALWISETIRARGKND
jgi:hypothetical protein